MSASTSLSQAVSLKCMTLSWLGRGWRRGVSGDWGGHIFWGYQIYRWPNIKAGSALYRNTKLVRQECIKICSCLIYILACRLLGLLDKVAIYLSWARSNSSQNSVKFEQHTCYIVKKCRKKIGNASSSSLINVNHWKWNIFWDIKRMQEICKPV